MDGYGLCSAAPPSRQVGVPPFEHAHRLERHPSRRGVDPVIDVEPHASGGAPVERPCAVFEPPRTQMADRFAEPWIRCRTAKERRGAKVIERPQDVVSPAARVAEAQEALVGGFARAQAAEEMALEQIVLAGPARHLGLW